MGSQTDLTRLRTAARTPIACPPVSPQRPGWSELQRESPKPPNLPRKRCFWWISASIRCTFWASSRVSCTIRRSARARKRAWRGKVHR